MLTHIGSKLLLEGNVEAIDKNTVALFNYNGHALSHKELAPNSGAIYTMKNDGRFNGAIAVEEATTNLLLNPVMNSATNWSGSNGSTLVVQTEPLNSAFPNKTTACIKNTVSASQTNGFTNQTVSLSLSTTYTLSAWVYIPSSIGGAIAGLNVWYINGSWIGIGGTTITERDEWVYKTYTFTSNATYASHVIGVGLSGAVAGNASYACFAQLEQKAFATSFINGARSYGTITYDIPQVINFTTSFWCKFNYEWYKAITSYNKKLIEFKNVESSMTICYTDYTNTLNTGSPFFDLETDALWDNTMHHWHSTFNYIKNEWYNINFIKNGNTMRIIIYNSSSKVVDAVFTYSNSSKFENFITNKLTIYGGWNASISELRIDDVARTDDEILGWYLSNAPFYSQKEIFTL